MTSGQATADAGRTEYTAWNAAYYDSRSRMFPRTDEVHGPFFARNEDDLKAQLKTAGLDPSNLRWEKTDRTSEIAEENRRAALAAASGAK